MNNDAYCCAPNILNGEHRELCDVEVLGVPFDVVPRRIMQQAILQVLVVFSVIAGQIKRQRFLPSRSSRISGLPVSSVLLSSLDSAGISAIVRASPGQS